MWKSVCVVMPAYNEGSGVECFIREIDKHLQDHAHIVSFIVVDDASTDDTAAVLNRLAVEFCDRFHVLRNRQNVGHGPSALRGYAAGLDKVPDVILHVDGDGQFHGSELPAILTALRRADIVHGRRQARSDPWYRKTLTLALRLTVGTLIGASLDVNTPLRAYRRAALDVLLREVPEGSLVPHLHLTLLEQRMGFTVVEVGVKSRPRRGGDSAGSTWGTSGWRFRLFPSRRLITFCLGAAREFLASTPSQDHPRLSEFPEAATPRSVA